MPETRSLPHPSPSRASLSPPFSPHSHPHLHLTLRHPPRARRVHAGDPRTPSSENLIHGERDHQCPNTDLCSLPPPHRSRSLTSPPPPPSPPPYPSATYHEHAELILLPASRTSPGKARPPAPELRPLTITTLTATLTPTQPHYPLTTYPHFACQLQSPCHAMSRPDPGDSPQAIHPERCHRLRRRRR